MGDQRPGGNGFTVKVRLCTKDGSLAHETEVPPINPLPEVIIWGTRFFVWKTERTYIEGIAWYADLIVPERNRRGGPYAEQLRTRIVSRLKEGWDQRTVMEEFGVSRNYVRRLMDELGMIMHKQQKKFDDQEAL